MKLGTMERYNDQIPVRELNVPDYLQVHSVWDTIQGEGPLIGMPAVFVRLYGCNLQCPLCDTDYTSRSRVVKLVELRNEIAAYKRRLCVFTGGEPLRQNKLSEMCRMLEVIGIRTQIETNGMLFAPLEDLPEETVVVCSPKTSTIHACLQDRIDAWKYVVADNFVDKADGLPTKVLGNNVRVARPTNDAPVYIQPLDTGNDFNNRRHVETALKVCMKFNYRLCLQTHKMVGMP